MGAYVGGGGVNRAIVLLRLILTGNVIGILICTTLGNGIRLVFIRMAIVCCCCYWVYYWSCRCCCWMVYNH